MRKSLYRWAIIGLLLALALGGCSMVRLGYNQAPHLIYWWLDAYVDFDEAQTVRTRQALDQWLDWQRHNQLPQLAALLQRAQAQVREATLPAQACAWQEDLREQIDGALEKAVPPLAELAVTLTPAQLKHAQRRFAKDIAERRAKYLQADRAERRAEAIKRAVDFVQLLYGNLDASQREVIARVVDASPFDAEVWIAERATRQRELLAAVTLANEQARRGEASAALAQAQAALRKLFVRPALSPRPAYRAYEQRLAAYNCAAAAQIHEMTTPAQRQTAQAKLKAWEDDLRTLAAQSGR